MQEAVEEVLAQYRWTPFLLLRRRSRTGLAIQCVGAAVFAQERCRDQNAESS
jgi:hypothetical protein